MRTALRDMQPWRRSLVEHGLTVPWLADQTGKAVNTVKAYAKGYRVPPADWLERADAAIAAYVRERDA
jgi:hypothetical protein